MRHTATKRDLRKRPTKKRCRHPRLKDYVYVSIKWGIQQLKETYKRDLQKRPTKETHKKTVQAPATKRLCVCVNQMRHTATKRDPQKRPTKEMCQANETHSNYNRPVCVNQIRHTNETDVCVNQISLMCASIKSDTHTGLLWLRQSNQTRKWDIQMSHLSNQTYKWDFYKRDLQQRCLPRKL